jgi:hypothetical protein
MFVWAPLETVLAQIERDGTVDAEGQRIVFREDMRGGRYDLVEALRGVIEFHELAASRHGLPVDVSALVRFANKLDAGSPLFESDISAVREAITACKRQALNLRQSWAQDILDTVRISAEIDRLKLRAA